MGEKIALAVVTGLLIPIILAMWKRRHAENPGAAEQLFFGVVLVGVGLGAGYFAVSLPFEAEDTVLDILLVLFKIALIWGLLLGVFVGGTTAWEALTKLSEAKNQGPPPQPQP